MKIPPLHEIDLARIAPLPREEKRHELERMRQTRPPWRYKPFRLSVFDILNIRPGPMIPATARTAWHVIEHDIRHNSRDPDEIAANLSVAKSLYNYACEHGLSGVRYDFPSLPIGISEKVFYWEPMVLDMGGQLTVPFFDPRVGQRLNPAARQFTFSVMHERIRRAYPDLANARFVIFQFSKPDEDDMRIAKAHPDTGIEMLGFEVLDEMIRETYQIWSEVRDDIRRRRTGTGGTLL